MLLRQNISQGNPRVFLLIEPLYHPWTPIKWHLPNVGENHTHALALPRSSAWVALSRVGLWTGLRNFALCLPFLVLCIWGLLSLSPSLSWATVRGLAGVGVHELLGLGGGSALLHLDLIRDY